MNGRTGPIEYFFAMDWAGLQRVNEFLESMRWTWAIVNAGQETTPWAP